MNYLKISILIDFIIDIIISGGKSLDDKKKLSQEWKYIKKHVELTKMHKYTSKNKFYER